jgi:anti-sigma factor RsiW
MNDEFRRYLEALDGEWEDQAGRHLQEDELIAYARGQLATDVERLQSHLLRCDACAAALKDVADFFGPRREGEEPIGERALRREWKTFWRRVQAEEGAAARKPLPIGFASRAMFALAASLLVAVGLMGFWTWHLRQET